MRLLCVHDRLITSSTNTLRVYTLESGAPALIADIKNKSVPDPDAVDRDGYPICAGGKGELFASLCVLGNSDVWWHADKRVELLDAQLRPVVVVPVASILNPLSLALSPDADRVAMNLHPGGVAVWAARAGEPVTHIAGHSSSGVSWSPCGRYLISGDSGQDEGMIYLIDLGSEGGPQRLDLPRPTSEMPLCDTPYASAWSPDGAAVAVSSAAWELRGIIVYDPQTLAERWSHAFPMEGDEGEEREAWSALDVAFAAGGAIVVAGLQDGALLAWRAADGRALDALSCDGATSTRFAVDDARRCIWYDMDGLPKRVDYPSDWS